MLRFYPLEEFKEIQLEGKLQLRYAISNFGRLLSFEEDMKKGRIVKGSLSDGYRIFRYKVRDENNKIRHKHVFLYKLVAQYFLEKETEDHVHVLHLDRNRANDYFKNLKWATKAEKMEHYKSSPRVIEAKKKLIEHRIKSDGNKLTVMQAIRLKKRLLDPNRKTRLKLLAKEFGVSEMTLYRIKSGENWGHLKV